MARRSWRADRGAPTVARRPGDQGRCLQDPVQKKGGGYNVEAGNSLKKYSKGTIPLNRKPDAVVKELATGNIVEIGEAYRPLKTSTRPASRHEFAKIPDYQQYNLPVLWWMVK